MMRSSDESLSIIHDLLPLGWVVESIHRDPIGDYVVSMRPRGPLPVEALWPSGRFPNLSGTGSSLRAALADAADGLERFRSTGAIPARCDAINQ